MPVNLVIFHKSAKSIVVVLEYLEKSVEKNAKSALNLETSNLTSPYSDSMPVNRNL